MPFDAEARHADPPGRRPGPLIEVCALSMLLLATGCTAIPSETTPTASAGASATAGRSLQQSPVVAPLARPGPTLPAGGGVGATTAPLARDAGGPAPFVPTGVVLPSGRRAAVVAADTAVDGVLIVPPDPVRVGWWTGGARVGDPYGSIVISGHVDSARFGAGVLAELGQVEPGDPVRLTSAAAQRTFRVRSIERVPKTRLATATDVFDQTGRPRLVLITCGGRFDPVARAYDDNLVVFADPLT